MTHKHLASRPLWLLCSHCFNSWQLTVPLTQKNHIVLRIINLAMFQLPTLIIGPESLLNLNANCWKINLTLCTLRWRQMTLNILKDIFSKHPAELKALISFLLKPKPNKLNDQYWCFSSSKNKGSVYMLGDQNAFAYQSWKIHFEELVSLDLPPSGFLTLKNENWFTSSFKMF